MLKLKLGHWLDWVFYEVDTQARFKLRATTVPNSIDRIKFDFSTLVARRLKPSRATAVYKRRAIAVPNSIHKS